MSFSPKTTLLLLSLLSLSLLLSSTNAKTVNIGLKHHRFTNQYHSTFSPNLREKIEEASRKGKGKGVEGDPNNNAMGGNILPVGIYWMTVEVGTPFQTFSAAVDSGSGDLIIPSQDCVGCHPDQTGEYNPKASSTSVNISCTGALSCKSCDSNNQCTFSNTYETCNLTAPQQSCTVSGPLYSDTFALGGESGVSPFGAITYQTSNFEQFFVIDAVVGFIPYLSSWGGQSLFQTLVDDKKYDNVFAMCMNAGDGGVITLGGLDDRLYQGEMAYTPRTNSPYFEIRVSEFEVNGERVSSVHFGAEKFIIDSGTNVLLLRTNNYEPIKNQIIDYMCPGFSGEGVCDHNANFFDQVCYPYTQQQIDQFPDVTIVAVGVDDAEVDLVMSGSDYVVQNGTTGEYCYGIKDTGPVGLNIIGDTTMQKYYVVFDQDKNQLGWGNVDMGYCMKIKNELVNEKRTFMDVIKG